MPERGEVWQVDFGITQKVRPALVISIPYADTDRALIGVWLEPQIELAVSKGIHSAELTELRRVVEERQDEIREHWNRHFRR